jgi:hypothetical protein
MWLLQKSLEGRRTATVFQTYALLNAYHSVYGREVDEDVGWVALALATKLRESKFFKLAKDKARLAALEVRESEVFAAALQVGAFLTLYDHALLAAQQRGLGATRELDCCAELALFGSLDWSAEQVVQAAQSWIAGQRPLAPDAVDAIAKQIAAKFKLAL